MLGNIKMMQQSMEPQGQLSVDDLDGGQSKYFNPVMDSPDDNVDTGQEPVSRAGGDAGDPMGGPMGPLDHAATGGNREELKMQLRDVLARKAQERRQRSEVFQNRALGQK